MARNPVIASLLQRSDYIEKMGTGISRIYNAMQLAKLPKPKFELSNFFVIELFRESYLENVGENVGEKLILSKLQKNILNMLKSNPQISAEMLAEEFGVAGRTIERNLKSLKDRSVIRRMGPDKGGFWEITN